MNARDRHFEVDSTGEPAISMDVNATARAVPSEDTCLEKLFRRRLAQLGHCPGCRSTRAKFHRARTRKAYICLSCKYTLHPCANTFLHKTSTRLEKWLHALSLVAATRGTITSRELAARLGLTYKCAWRIRHHLTLATRAEWPLIALSRADPDHLLEVLVRAAMPEGEMGPSQTPALARLSGYFGLESGVGS